MTETHPAEGYGSLERHGRQMEAKTSIRVLRVHGGIIQGDGIA